MRSCGGGCWTYSIAVTVFNVVGDSRALRSKLTRAIGALRFRSLARPSTLLDSHVRWVLSSRTPPFGKSLLTLRRARPLRNPSAPLQEHPSVHTHTFTTSVSSSLTCPSQSGVTLSPIRDMFDKIAHALSAGRSLLNRSCLLTFCCCGHCAGKSSTGDIARRAISWSGNRRRVNRSTPE